MTTFYICRHGESENNKRKLSQGWIDTPLTEEGKQNALSSATKLRTIKFSRVVSSDLGRAFETAYLIAKELSLTNKIELDKGLREINYGDFANQPYSVLPKLPPEKYAAYVMPNGESLIQMQQRVLDTVKELAANSLDQTVLLVAHDGTINAIRASFSGENIGEADSTSSAHDFVAKFVVNDGQTVSFEEV